MKKNKFFLYEYEKNLFLYSLKYIKKFIILL